MTTNHVGHKICNPSECIADAFQQLNNIIQGKKSAHFSLKQIKETLQNNQDRLKDHVEEIVQHVLERVSKIVREVKKACVKTIKQIKQHAMNIDTPMKKDEEILQNFIACEEFENENVEEFIKYMSLLLQWSKITTRQICCTKPE